MKLKKMIMSASAVIAGSGMITTLLTSCGAASIDDELKIDLQSDGTLSKLDKLGYKDAVKNALLRSSSWATFKQALSDEIVYKWYIDRAAAKNKKDKNTSFRNFLDEAEYNVNKDYDNLVNDLKAEYGNNYKFYLQNQYLSVNGGTEETYKHVKMVEKVVSEFKSNVFAYNYFGMASGDIDAKLPSFFTKVNTSVAPEILNNDNNWEKIGFYAKVNPSFAVEDFSDPNKLAKNPDGDYATIQSYVFDRWFETEKPFFSAASLFKYSTPKSAESLDKVYNSTKTTIPDEPNEAFPYFGGISDSTSAATGAKAYAKWFEAFNKGEFHDAGMYTSSSSSSVPDTYNGTISIPTEYTEDSQTLLLSYATKMIAGDSNTLYVPYAISAASLYNQMFGNGRALLNTITQETITQNLENKKTFFDDDTTILSNFMYSVLPSTITSYIDLSTVYGSVEQQGQGNIYHCPIFKENSDFDFFYGSEMKSGVKYATSNVQVELTPSDGETVQQTTQPWVFELNESGMHAQTIDGYEYVTREGTDDPQEALKCVLMYRLLEQKAGYDDGMISASVLGSSGDLSTYFTNNYVNIILEMASSTDYNIFVPIDKIDPSKSETSNFLTTVLDEQKFGVTLVQLMDYLDKTKEIDTAKKLQDAIIALNEKIYSYRSEQITNATLEKDVSQTIYSNGLLAPIPLSYESKNGQTHYYTVATIILPTDWEEDEVTTSAINSLIANLKSNAFVTKVNNVAVDGTNAFSPQIANAKNVLSNRYWYASPLIDKMMYTYMGSNDLANQIRLSVYKTYEETDLGSGCKLADIIKEGEDSSAWRAIASTYYSSKLLTDSKNISSYMAYGDETDFFSVMKSNYTKYLTDKTNDNGEYCDDEVSRQAFLISLVYLAKNNFENFYKALNTKIADNEKAFVGYLAKYNTESSYITKPEVETTDLNAVYGWTNQIDNLYDRYDMAGTNSKNVSATKRYDYTQFWNVVYDNVTKNSFAGFLGLQTQKNNSLSVNSDLESAAFTNFAKATYQSETMDNGSLFAWANPESKKDEFKIQDVEWNGNKITNDDVNNVLPSAKKLAYQISICSQINDLKDIATSLDEALMNKSTVFHTIGEGTEQITDKNDPVTEIKWKMLNELIKTDGTPAAATHVNWFERVEGVELHTTASLTKAKYCFESGADGYKLYMTQINKSDVTYKLLTPTFANSTWTMAEDSPLSIQEFWYIFCKIAMESSNQTQAINDVVKQTLGSDKLEVYDAQLYNQFSSVWIKDWEKKPIGS